MCCKFRICFSIIALLSPIAFGASQLGVSLVGPTGINGKIWMSKSAALDAAMTWNLSEDFAALYLHADYLHHVYGPFQVEGGEMPFYVGVGGKTNLQDSGDPSFGVRVPIGVTYLYGSPIFDVFFELAPFLDLYPSVRTSLDGAMGFRFFL